MRRRRHEGQRSARGYLESPKRPGRPERHPAWVLGLINARIPGGQRSFACISSRIATVIQVTVRAIKGTITDLMSHSQFHCTGRVYLDLHGLIFETSICYWQDQPGSPQSPVGAGTPARPVPWERVAERTPAAAAGDRGARGGAPLTHRRLGGDRDRSLTQPRVTGRGRRLGERGPGEGLDGRV